MLYRGCMPTLAFIFCLIFNHLKKKLLLLPEDGLDERSAQLFLASFWKLTVAPSAKNGCMSILPNWTAFPTRMHLVKISSEHFCAFLCLV